jgi:predicted ArsR family transcriptional regulator
MGGRHLLDEIGAVAALDDPVRRRIYFMVTDRGDEVTRDQAAAAIGISRSLAAFHLDRLVRDGLLTPSYRRVSGKSGPGAGRPSKLYRRSERQVQIMLPQRQYELAARILAGALETDEPKRALDSVARETGRLIGRQANGARSTRARRGGQVKATVPVLRECGYEPYIAANGALRLRNCPFHGLAGTHRELVCRMNHELVIGIVKGLELENVDAVLSPAPGECCVAISQRKEDPAS